MTFKENLLKKIEIEKLTGTILKSIGPPESGRKVDKESMRCLLDMGAFEYYSAIGPTPTPNADINKDGVVDEKDLLLLKERWHAE